MFWYRVDVEIFLLGKESEVVKADNSNTAETIAIKKIESKFGVSENEILNISSTKLNYQT